MEHSTTGERNKFHIDRDLMHCSNLSFFRKIAPFRPVLQSTVNSNGYLAVNGDHGGSTGAPSYLSSIQDIRSSRGSSASGHSHVGGFHPPIPPKPKNPEGLIQQRNSPPRQAQAVARPTSERELIRELIFSFQGIEGTVLRRKNDRFAISEQYKKNLPPSVVQISLRLAELGWLYSKVDAACTQMQEDEREVGLVGQSFITAMKNELSEYYRLLSLLEEQLKETEVGLSLHHLSVWTMEPTNRMKLIASMADTCKLLRGGALISAVYSFLHHGDPSSSETVRAILCTVCKPMYLMLLRWICDGVLEDPFNEFFIAYDPKMSGDRLWHDKYSIRNSMIPKFLGLAWVKKVLATGKSINFLHEVCHDNSPISGRDVVKESLDKITVESFFSHPQGSDSLFHQTIQRAFADTSAHVLSILFTRYKFLDHITAMRKYLLLGQGDIIRYLLELLEDELCQPATALYPHNLSGILETAIRATNTQFEDPDILERLDVQLLDIQPGDTGWDVFTLDYKVVGPIGTIFGQRTMTHYLMLFNALWRSKRIEWLLSCVWKRQASLHKMTKTVPELKPILHLANLLSSEMVHFVHQMAYYVTFEVMECSWDILMKQLRQAESLDEVIEAHEDFLQTLMKRSLLDERSRDLLTQLRAIYDRILEFNGIQNKLYVAAVSEVEARQSHREAIRRKGRAGEYGLTSADEDRERRRARDFSHHTLNGIKSQLKIVSQSYQDMLRTFLVQLASNNDQALQCLSFRLDFNQHYKRKDARLVTPLTFQHRRESMQSSITSI